jgi:hypothetical protein
MRAIAEELVRRYEQYLELVPGRPMELEASKEKVPAIRFTERVFRDFSEQYRNVCEIIEDTIEDLPPPASKPKP